MHQGHNIPWAILSSNFHFVENDTSYTPAKTELITTKTPNGPRELKHFIKKFIHTISIFSETERKKYPAKMSPLAEDKLFSDDLLAKYPKYLNKNNQKLEFWTSNKRTYGGYQPWDVVTILLYENELSTLLMLAQHPSISLIPFHHNSLGRHFGWCRVKESAVRSYLFFNSAEATGTLENGKYACTREYIYLLEQLVTPRDQPVQPNPHLRFLDDCGLLKRDQNWGHIFLHCPYIDEARVDKQASCLQEYLKQLFTVMYRYDVLARECGIDPKWEEEIALDYPLRGCVDMRWDARQMKHILT